MPAVRVKECRTAAEVFENYRAVRARVSQWRAPVKVIAITLLEPTPTVFPIVQVEVKAEVVVPPEPVAPPPVPTPILLKRILAEVAQAYNLTINDMQCAGRQQRLCEARREYCYRAATETLASFPQIGKVLGDREHTTVMHSIAKYCLIHNLTLPRGAAWTKPHKVSLYGTVWPRDRVNELRRLRDLGLSNFKIGKELGCTAGSVCGAVHQFKLPLRNSKHHPVDTFNAA